MLFGDLPESEIEKALTRHRATKIMVVYGSGSIKRSGILDKILAEIKIPYVEHGGVVANPLISHGNAGIDLARREGVDFILAIGGGSVIDEAKYIAVGAYGTQDAEKLFRTGQNTQDALPVGAVLTLPAAGSECSTASVVRCDETGQKFSMGGTEALRCVFAYINPRYCMTLPKDQIAYGASDILAHMIERFFSPQDNVRVTDELLIGGMKAVMEIAPKLMEDPTSYELWAEFCLIGSLAHNGWLSLGRDKQDWATHRIENKLLSGIHNIAHGQGLAILFPAWMKHNEKKYPTRFKQFYSEVATPKQLTDWYKSLGLKLTLSEVGLDAEQIKREAMEVYPPDWEVGDFSQTTVGDMLVILDLAK